MESKRIASMEREIRELGRRLDMKEAQLERMKLSHLFLQTLFDGIQEEIMVIDPHHVVLDANRVFLDHHGLLKEEAVGRKCHQITYQSDLPCDLGGRICPLKQAKETGKRGEVTHIREDDGGGKREILRMMYPLVNDAGVAEYFVEISRDMTEQRRMEKALVQSERLAAVGKIVAHVAHEIKNPLMIIGGFTQQVRKSLSDERGAQKLDMALREVRRLERLVAQLGDVTREQRLVRRMVNVNSVITDLLEMMAETNPSGTYRFVADLSWDLDDFECDPDKMKQVLMNLIVNGLEAMKQGGTLTVRTRRSAHGLEIAVSDEGEGISEQKMDRIFEPFYSTRDKGSGLGLPISFRIVKAHEGDIFAQSRVGKGTTFFVRLPGARAEFERKE